MNKQITEDYVSYEIAVLLKEKGFDWQQSPFYSEQYMDEWKQENSYQIPNPDYDPNIPFDTETITMVAPHISQSIALKWLREVHNIVIEINLEDYMTTENGELQVWYSYTIWTFIRHLGETGLTDSRYDDRAFWQENVKVGQSYEEAVEAACLYVLKNLL